MEQEAPDLEWFLATLESRWPGCREGDQFVKEAILVIWKQLSKASDVESIIDQIPTTRRTIERRFRRQLNCSIREVAAFARLELAKWLLTNTSLPIYRIAARAGYSSSDWFGKVMRRDTGLTPGEFRRLARTSPDPKPS